MLLHCRSAYTCVSCAFSRPALGSLTDPATDATTSCECSEDAVFRSIAIGGTHIATGDV